ncbi:MAG: fumarylacetoacetate hydrolase family protein [Nocardioides sp.]|uniref:fumarylacetoacetate hydrolase family protein n=1 Tax=Nocardioides sp. TaxID=35761 RepID=UPI0039E517EC
MRLATFSGPDAVGPRTGVVAGDRIHPLPEGLSMREVVDRGLAAAAELGRTALAAPGIALDDVRLLAPLEPASVRDFVAFEAHVEGVRRSIDRANGVPAAWYDAPAFYFTNPHAIVGPDAEVAFPHECRDRDFELEVAVVVSGDGRSLSVAQAEEHIFGYTIMNDFSARDLQGREMQVGLGPAKGKDFATGLGPFLVTADEVESHRDADGLLDLGCTVSVNDVEIGRDRLTHMGWSFAAMIAYASRDSLVTSGDVLGSGTTGDGCLAEFWGRRGERTPPPLQVGDVVRIEVDVLGTLSNTVTQAPPAPALPPFRRG